MNGVETEKIEFTDRYGGRGPSLWSICPGQCEGLGSVPVYRSIGDTHDPEALVKEEADHDLALIEAWIRAEAVSPSEDGWHFVTCPECGGTGKTRGFWPRVRQVFRNLDNKWRFARGHVLVLPYTSGTAALALIWQKDHAQSMVEVPRPVATDPEVQAVLDREWNGGDDDVERRWETPACPFRVGYGDRLDVPHSWFWNRRLALRVLFGRIG